MNFSKLFLGFAALSFCSTGFATASDKEAAKLNLAAAGNSACDPKDCDPSDPDCCNHAKKAKIVDKKAVEGKETLTEALPVKDEKVAEEAAVQSSEVTEGND